MSMIKQFEAMLASGQDNALLRYSLGSAWLKEGDFIKAADHLQQAIIYDEGYSAAYKLLGKALTESARETEAIAVYEKGIDIADKKGDKQAGREMQVFLKRLQKSREISS